MADKVSHKDISVCNESLHLYTANYIFMQILCKKSCIQVHQIITSLLGYYCYIMLKPPGSPSGAMNNTVLLNISQLQSLLATVSHAVSWFLPYKFSCFQPCQKVWFGTAFLSSPMHIRFIFSNAFCKKHVEETSSVVTFSHTSWMITVHILTFSYYFYFLYL